MPVVNRSRKVLFERSIGSILKVVSHLIRLPRKHMWLDYDTEADVVYLHFEEKPRSTHSEMREDGIILDYKGRKLVGLTILEASQR